jgi:RNA-directed DNA polymerase
MDCIRDCLSRINTKNKFLWIIEGDIKGCFDHVQHAILLKLIRRRVMDERVLKLIAAQLRAGLMENGLYQATPEGSPQGSCLSPLLANIYLHEFDRWWWENYGQLTPHQKARRRQAGVGNCILTRYADDFVLLCNGPRSEAERLREEARQVLWDQLRLELSLEKTHITHATEGFDFLGFHLQWKLPKSGKPWLRVTPSAKSIDRFKRTVKAMTRRDTFYQNPLEKIRSLNRVMRGWNQYYEYVSATDAARKLTFWARARLYLWLKKRHHRPVRWLLQTYRVRERCGQRDRWNFGVKDEAGKMVYFYHLTDLHRRVYYIQKRPNPYLTGASEDLPVPDSAFPLHWDGSTTPEQAQWAARRREVLERDGYRCVHCGRSDHLHVHHQQPRRQGGSDQMDNLQTLCDECHRATATYGHRKPRVDAHLGELDDGKLSCPVR